MALRLARVASRTSSRTKKMAHQQTKASVSISQYGEAGLYPHGMRSLSDPKTMEQILSQRLSKELKTEPLETQSRFLKPVSAFFSMDGKQKRWDFVESMPSVAVALVDIDLQSLIVVRQFRAPVYHHMCKEVGQTLPMAAGFTYELCAGLIDKEGKTLEEITSEEIHEECGYSVEPSRLLKVASHVTSAGVNGVRQTIFAARVSAKDRQGGGGGGLDVDGEAIEVLAVPLSRLEEFLEDESLPKSAGLQFAGLWVLRKGVETLP